MKLCTILECQKLKRQGSWRKIPEASKGFDLYSFVQLYVMECIQKNPPTTLPQFSRKTLAIEDGNFFAFPYSRDKTKWFFLSKMVAIKHLKGKEISSFPISLRKSWDICKAGERLTRVARKLIRWYVLYWKLIPFQFLPWPWVLRVTAKEPFRRARSRH